MPKIVSNSVLSRWKQLATYLRQYHYEFTTVTPVSHKRYLERNPHPVSASPLACLRSLLGWSQEVPFESIPLEVGTLLKELDLLFPVAGSSKVRCPIRFSTLKYSSQNDGESLIFIHSAFPTEQENSVFFGPDTYRFTQFLKNTVQPFQKAIDLGCGSGAGGICLKKYMETKAGKAPLPLWLTDISDKALVSAEINKAMNSVKNTEVLKSNLLQDVPDDVDLIVSNPPFIIDSKNRAYRHGGSYYGLDLSIQIVESSLSYLKKEGQLALYTGTSILGGQDLFWEKIKPLLKSQNLTLHYSELDPDIFSEELSEKGYEGVERIAAVGLYIKKH